MKYFHQASCIVCGSKKLSKRKKQVLDHAITKATFDLYQCDTCQFIFTQDAPSQENIGRYYQSEAYISHSDIKKGIVNKLYHFVRRLMHAHKSKLIMQYVRSKANLIDIGCGTGHFIYYMKQKGHFTLGVEINADARAYGKEVLHVDILSVEKFKTYETPKASCVTLWHALEHLYDPSVQLKKIFHLLQDDGYVFIALPNHTSYDAQYYKNDWAGYDVPRHLWHFSPSTFKVFVQKHGFDVVAMKRLPFDSFYNAILSEKYRKNSLGFIKGMLIGFIACMVGLLRIQKASSIIFIMKKRIQNHSLIA